MGSMQNRAQFERAAISAECRRRPLRRHGCYSFKADPSRRLPLNRRNHSDSSCPANEMVGVQQKIVGPLTNGCAHLTIFPTAVSYHWYVVGYGPGVTMDDGHRATPPAGPMSGRSGRPTMRDVAAHVGVSQSLVSLVFRNAPGASAETRDRVLRAADELGYRLDTAAQ